MFNVGQLKVENLLQEVASAAAKVQRDGVIQHGIERARVQQHRHVTSSQSNLRRRFAHLMTGDRFPSSVGTQEACDPKEKGTTFMGNNFYCTNEQRSAT